MVVGEDLEKCFERFLEVVEGVREVQLRRAELGVVEEGDADDGVDESKDEHERADKDDASYGIRYTNGDLASVLEARDQLQRSEDPKAAQALRRVRQVGRVAGRLRCYGDEPDDLDDEAEGGDDEVEDVPVVRPEGDEIVDPLEGDLRDEDEQGQDIDDLEADEDGGRGRRSPVVRLEAEDDRVDDEHRQDEVLEPGALDDPAGPEVDRRVLRVLVVYAVHPPVVYGHRLHELHFHDNKTLYNTIQYNIIQCNTIPYNTIQYSTIQCNIIQCNAIQYNTV